MDEQEKETIWDSVTKDTIKKRLYQKEKRYL